jgi:hypothetical protein
LADSTHTKPAPLRFLAAALVLACALGFVLRAPAARADGDPASDVLAAQSLFLPSDGAIAVAEQQRLASLVKAARRSGYRIRVALIATPSDLGSIGALWRRPSSYARFLGQELSLVYPGTLLVVMPNGFGVSRAGRSLPGPAGVPAPGTGSRLATAALTAVQSLAARAGHRLAVPGAAPAPAPVSGASSNLGAWVAFAVGLFLIALAWAASLRQRPLGRAGGDQSRGADTSTAS